jgi:hypothetical protein
MFGSPQALIFVLSLAILSVLSPCFPHFFIIIIIIIIIITITNGKADLFESQPSLENSARFVLIYTFMFSLFWIWQQ